VQDVIQTIKKVQAETVQRERPAGVGIVYCSYVETVRQAVYCWKAKAKLIGSVNSFMPL
jgi:hypothetical protein